MPTQLDHYVTLGRSGLRVSPLCLGAMTFGEEWGFGVGPEESGKLMNRYLEAGGNFIDTANIYNKGHSEQIMGDYFAAKGGGPGNKFPARDRVVIATKWLGNMYPGDPNGGGAHRKALMESVDQSLRRLQTDYIDLLWLHFWDAHTPIDETMRGLDTLVNSGKVRYIGFSDTPAWKCAQAQMIAEFRGWSPLIALQIEYSLLERTVEGELIPMAKELGMGVTPWSPLKGGILTGKYTRDSMPDRGRYKQDSRYLNDRTFAIVDEMASIAGRHECTVPEVALAWVRQQSGVQSTIIGARTMEQLAGNLRSLQVELSEKELTSLAELSAPTLPFPHDFLGNIGVGIQNGTTVNGVSADPWGGGPADDGERW
ncbi:MAG: aldo/keto reductase [Planctomycetota bacterium]